MTTHAFISTRVSPYLRGLAGWCNESGGTGRLMWSLSRDRIGEVTAWDCTLTVIRDKTRSRLSRRAARWFQAADGSNEVEGVSL